MTARLRLTRAADSNLRAPAPAGTVPPRRFTHRSSRPCRRLLRKLALLDTSAVSRRRVLIVALAPSTRSPGAALVACSAAVALQGSVEAADQGASVKGLGQEADRSVLERARAHALFGKPSDENERHATTPGAQVRLQFDPAHGRHLDVYNCARRVVQLGRLQKRLGRRKRMNGVSERPYEIIRRGANRCIVVND